MKIHIITLSWNGIEMLETLRTGLAENLAPFYMKEGKIKEGCEVPIWHIRDNGSKDNTVEEVSGWQYRSDTNLDCKVYDIGHNRDSFATGCNYLVEQAEPDNDDLILLLNNDIEFFGDNKSLLKMYKLMKKTGAGAVGARLLYNGTNKLQHAGVIFSERYNKLPFHYRPGKVSDAHAEKNRYFQVVTAACALVKASSFKHVGGFDNKLIWAFDDVDLFLRIGQTEKIAYCGETKIYHEESASLKKNNLNKLFMNSNVKYFKSQWNGKIKMDLEKYEKDPSYNEIRI